MMTMKEEDRGDDGDEDGDDDHEDCSYCAEKIIRSR